MHKTLKLRYFIIEGGTVVGQHPQCYFIFNFTFWFASFIKTPHLRHGKRAWFLQIKVKNPINKKLSHLLFCRVEPFLPPSCPLASPSATFSSPVPSYFPQEIKPIKKSKWSHKYIKLLYITSWTEIIFWEGEGTKFGTLIPPLPYLTEYLFPDIFMY